MTINTTSISSGPFTGTNSTDTYTYNFKVQLSSEIGVVETTVLGVASTLVEGTDFSVTGVGDAGGGTVVRTAGNLPTGATWLISRTTALTQEADFPGQGAFTPQSHENAFDKAMAIIQEINGRTMFVDGRNPMTGDLDMGGHDINDIGSAFVDELYIGGILSTVTAFSENNIAKTYANVAAMLAASDLAVGNTAVTQGYITAGDGGHAAYRIVAAATGTDDGGSYHDLTGITGQAELLREDVVRVKTFGAIGDDTAIDSLSIIRAIVFAGVGGTIMFKPGDTYLIDMSLPAAAGQTFYGYGATLHAAPEIKSVITDVSLLGVAIANVTDGSLFTIGQEVTFAVDQTKYSQANSITNIVGNVITLSNTITSSTGPAFTAAEGAFMISTVQFISGGAAANQWLGAFTPAGVTVLGLAFDGNKANNTSANRWEYLRAMTSLGDYSTVRDCTFDDLPGEGPTAFGDHCSFENIHFKETNGNPIHLSTTRWLTVRRMTSINCNLDTGVGHAGGAIEYSSTCKGLNVDGLFVDGGLAAIAGLSDQSPPAIITNVFVKNTTAFAIQLAGSNGGPINGITMSNIYMQDCGAFQITSQFVATIEKVHGITLSNIHAVRTPVVLSAVSNSAVSNMYVRMGTDPAQIVSISSHLTAPVITTLFDHGLTAANNVDIMNAEIATGAQVINGSHVVATTPTSKTFTVAADTSTSTYTTLFAECYEPDNVSIPFFIGNSKDVDIDVHVFGGKWGIEINKCTGIRVKGQAKNFFTYGVYVSQANLLYPGVIAGYISDVSVVLEENIGAAAAGIYTVDPVKVSGCAFNLDLASCVAVKLVAAQSSGSTIVNNTVEKIASTVGIWAAVNSDNNIIMGNTFTDDAVLISPLDDDGTDNFWKNNYRIGSGQDIRPAGYVIPALDNTGTPSVASGSDTYLTGGTTAITDFDDGIIGQRFTVLSDHAITITDGAPIILAGGVDFVMKATDSLTLIYKADANWYEVSRSVN